MNKYTILHQIEELKQTIQWLIERDSWKEIEIQNILRRLEGYPLEVWPDDYEDSTEATEDKQI